MARLGLIRTITDGARTIDQWLQENFGRPYNGILGVGLVLEIVHRIEGLPETWKSGQHDLLGTVLALAMESALLLHQLGEFSERAEHRRKRRAAKIETRD